jgi:hypothetical protein
LRQHVPQAVKDIKTIIRRSPDHHDQRQSRATAGLDMTEKRRELAEAWAAAHCTFDATMCAAQRCRLTA